MGFTNIRKIFLLNLKGYKVFYKERVRAEGGVLLYVLENLHPIGCNSDSDSN